MRSHNICLYKKVNKKYTGCNLKTTEIHECALIGVCAVIRSNTECFRGEIRKIFTCYSFLSRARSGWIPLEVEFKSSLYGPSLHRASHSHPSIFTISLKYSLGHSLNFTTLWAYSADNNLIKIFLFFPENRRQFAWNGKAYFLKKKRRKV